MKKILIFFVTPVAMLLATMIKLPDVESYLDHSIFKKTTNDSINQSITSKIDTLPNQQAIDKSAAKSLSPDKTQDQEEREGWLTYVVLVEILIILSTLITYYIMMYSPYAKYEELAKKRWSTIEDITSQLKEKHPRHILNFNIMIPKRRFFFFIEPSSDPEKKKFSFTGQVFKVIWSNGDPVHKKFKMTVNQGHAGQVFRDGRKISGLDLSKQSGATLNLTPAQMEIFSDIKMLVSCPIYTRKSYVNNQKIKIIGVLNVEGTSEGSEKLALRQSKSSNRFYDDIIVISEVCANLLET